MQTHTRIFSGKYPESKAAYSDLLRIKDIDKKIRVIREWQDGILSKRILRQKEEQLKSAFLQSFFGEVLGYAYGKGLSRWHLEEEQKTVADSTKMDGASGFFSVDQNGAISSDIRVVIELKNARTDLDRPQNRQNDRRTPVQQAFDYANSVGGTCQWVILSDFVEIRLYYQNDLLDKIKRNGVNLEKLYYLSTGAEIHGKEKKDKDGGTISGRSKFDVLHKDYQTGFKEYIEGAAIEKSKQGRYCYPKIDYYLNYGNPAKMRSPKFSELFESNKIIIRRSSGLLGILATFDNRKLYTSEKCLLIISKNDLPEKHPSYDTDKINSLKYILSILNSRLIYFYYKSVYSGFMDIYPNYLKSLPIIEISADEQQPFIEKADIMLSQNKALQLLRDDFLSFLQSELRPQKITGKLENWHESDWNSFKSELAKGNVRLGDLSLKARKEWQEYFNGQKAKAVEINQLIDTTDKAVDQMVYKLYGLIPSRNWNYFFFYCCETATTPPCPPQGGDLPEFPLEGG